jgi:hypothetical protein
LRYIVAQFRLQNRRPNLIRPGIFALHTRHVVLVSLFTFAAILALYRLEHAREQNFVASLFSFVFFPHRMQNTGGFFFIVPAAISMSKWHR